MTGHFFEELASARCLLLAESLDPDDFVITRIGAYAGGAQSVVTVRTGTLVVAYEDLWAGQWMSAWSQDVRLGRFVRASAAP